MQKKTIRKDDIRARLIVHGLPEMKGRGFSSFKEGLEDGVYIKIGPRTSINHIKEYLRTNGKRVRDAQRLFLKVTKVPLAKKPKLHGNFKRDNWIASLSEWSRSELKSFGGVGQTKYAMISHLMRLIGYNKGIMNPDIVKMAIQRRRKMIKASASE